MLVRQALTALTRDNADAVKSLIELADEIRGYEDIKLARIAEFRAQAHETRAALVSPTTVIRLTRHTARVTPHTHHATSRATAPHQEPRHACRSLAPPRPRRTISSTSSGISPTRNSLPVSTSTSANTVTPKAFSPCSAAPAC